MEIKGIKYTGPFLDNSGYGKAARGNILALHNAGVPLTLSPISFEECRPDLGEEGNIIRSLMNKNIEYNVNFIHSTPEHWASRVIPNCVNVGFTIWETDKLHDSWPGYINEAVDKVIVGCEWNRDVFKDSGVTVPIGVVPHGITMSEFDNIKPYNIKGVTDEFMFYSIFQWQTRKNPEDLIKAYWHAFSGQDDVVLALKTYRYGYSDTEKDAVRQSILALKKSMPMKHYPKIVLIPNMLSEDEIRGLHARGDCYISLDRGEGFGLSGLSAGAVGNPIIVTGYGGVKEYAKHDNSYLVDYSLTPVSGMPQSLWYTGNMLWAQPNLTDAMDKMRSVYTNRVFANECGGRLKEFIKDNLSWEVIANRLIDEITAIGR